jgi:predicted phage terminase large subunit-like protein|tara:strand:+ start:540 stop:1898 length:1359 start_codon:yes stop_codon:yes gene_type:complete
MKNINGIIKSKCEDSLLFFTRYIFKENTGIKFEVANFHIQLANTLEQVFNGDIKRLIINIPPRYGKTEIAVKMYISWCLAKNPKSKFIHLSYSDALALDNSSMTREYILSDAFQKIWQLQLKKDSQSRKKWYTTQGGGVYATASGGAITGFGAGNGGAIIIDDPLKPDDALSDVRRSFINNRYNTTIRSRVNDRDVPIIVIMQRLHEDDLSGYLIEGNSGEQWHHLKLSAIDVNNKPLWPSKHSFKELEAIRQADRYTFAGQYMQDPAPDEGGEWRKDWFNIINKAEMPNDIQWEMFIDGAYTKDTRNDPTGIQISGKSNDNLYILKSIDKYLEMPELKSFIVSFVKSCGVHINQILVEPKASGKSLVQLLRRETNYNVSELKTDFVRFSKIERARASSPFIEGGRVYLIKDGWNDAYLQQVGTFPNAKHDEHIDVTAYAIERNLIKNFFVV